MGVAEKEAEYIAYMLFCHRGHVRNIILTNMVLLDILAISSKTTTNKGLVFLEE